MIKLTFCLTRLPHLSRDEFQAYWRGTHAPLVASVAETLQIRRYVQLHSLPSAASTPIRESRDAPPEYDGVAELWFDSLDSLAQNGAAPKPRPPAAFSWKTNANSSTCRNRPSGGAKKNPSSADPAARRRRKTKRTAKGAKNAKSLCRRRSRGPRV